MVYSKDQLILIVMIIMIKVVKIAFFSDHIGSIISNHLAIIHNQYSHMDKFIYNLCIDIENRQIRWHGCRR